MALGSSTKKTCRNCGTRFTGQGFRSPTGAVICRNCHDMVVGATVAGMTGGGLGAAIAMAGNDPEKGGILNWVRKALRPPRTTGKD